MIMTSRLSARQVIKGDFRFWSASLSECHRWISKIGRQIEWSYIILMWVRLHSAKIYILWRRKNKPARVGANSHWLFTAGVALENHSIWKWDSKGRRWLVGWQEGWFNDCRRLQFGQLWKAVRVGETEPVLGLCLFSRTLKRSVWSRRQRATILISRIIDSCIYSSRHLS